MRTITELQALVGEWSRDCFDEQVSKTTRCVLPRGEALRSTDKEVHPMDYTLPTIVSFDAPMVLGSLAPLLGIGEEIGELAKAHDRADIEDAYGDIVIYSCDFACREDLILDEGFFAKPAQTMHGDRGLIRWHGDLCHAVLKRHQGIRGFDDYAFYCEKRNEALRHLLTQLWFNCSVILGPNRTIVDIANETFDKIVSKRNWKARPKDADKSDFDRLNAVDQEGF